MLAAEDRLRERARAHLLESAEVKRQLARESLDEVVAAARLIAESLAGGGKLLLCGNGGSAADCQHVAAEFVSRLSADFERPGLPAIALTTDSSFLTAYANDYSFDGVFERQVLALGKPGDVLIGISTSGGSRNVILAVEAAAALSMGTIILTGRDGPLTSMGQVTLSVPSRNTQYVQEAHLAIEHAMVDLAERFLYGDVESVRSGQKKGTEFRRTAS